MRSKECLRTDVILDARMIHHTGIGTYVRGILEGFDGHPFFQKYSLGIASLPASPADRPSIARNDDFLPFRSPIYSLQEQIEYPFRLSRSRLWHSPHYNIPLAKRKTRLVATVHDLIHWLFRKEHYSSIQAAYTQFFFNQLVRSADRIIAVSQHTRDDLVRYFNAPIEKIRVIYEGVSETFSIPLSDTERSTVLEKYRLPQHFFLYVGLIKPHKNIQRLIEVFSRLRRKKGFETELVVIGKKDRAYPRRFESLAKLTTQDGIHYLPQVDSLEDLTSLYASAKALVHPSLYEGFGLTCLEAMAVGTPVVASRAASLPEVVGEAGYYIDPYSEDSIEKGLVEMAENESLREELSRRGREHSKQFSWKKAAEETIRVYEEVLG